MNHHQSEPGSNPESEDLTIHWGRGLGIFFGTGIGPWLLRTVVRSIRRKPHALAPEDEQEATD